MQPEDFFKKGLPRAYCIETALVQDDINNPLSLIHISFWVSGGCIMSVPETGSESDLGISLYGSTVSGYYVLRGIFV